MASNITLSAGVRQNLLSLQNTADLMSTTQNRLATGKKVNSALDNPTSFFTAQSLQSRAGDMSSLLDNMTSGIKTLEAADNGLSAITKTVESMQSTLRQARQDKSFKTESFTINLGASPAGTEELSFVGGAVGTTAVDVALTTTGGPSAATVAGTAFTAMDFTAAAATSGSASFTFGAGGSLDTAATIDFDVEVDGVVQSVSITQAEVLAAGNADSTIDDAAEFRSILNAQGLTGVTVGGTGANITITSAATGTTSDVNITAPTIGGTAGSTTASAANLGLTGGVNGTAGAAAGAAKSFSFDIDIDGSGSPTTVTINAAAVATVGNSDNVIDDVAELVSIIDAQVGAGATVAGTGGVINFTSATTGLTSEIDITNVTATNITNTSGISNASDAGAATGGTTVVARTVDEMVTAINGTAALEGKVRASNDGGKLRIENLSTAELTVNGAASSDLVADGVGSTEIGGNTVRTNLVKQFNELRDQLDKLADDASYNGVNLLRGDLLKLTFNETGTSTIEIQAKDEAGAERAINSSTLGIESASDADFDSDDAIDTILDGMKDALGVLRSQSSSFGSNLSIVENRTEFTKSMINTLQTGADSLVLADTNEEAANMLALQTRQQLSSTALSLASQADQAVLRLF